MYMGDKPKSKRRSYTTVNIPWVLMERIDAVIRDGRHGYVRRSDFILDAIRRRLRELDYLE
jgi:metal-responsive CopG/Arc/MetJ family transcriptional regulator